MSKAIKKTTIKSHAPSRPDRNNAFLAPPDTTDLDEIFRYALTGKESWFDGYDHASAHLGVSAGDLANRVIAGKMDVSRLTFEELRVCLFFEQRRWRHYGDLPEGEDLKKILELYAALRAAWHAELD